jgi:hypothetical protein
MSDLAMSGIVTEPTDEPTFDPAARPDPDAAPDAAATVAAGDKVGPVHVVAARADRVELYLPGELGWGRAIVGLVPIVWCAAAWTLCLREGLLDQRIRGCVALSLMAAVSAVLMVSSLGTTWRFDGRRRTIARRAGLLARTHNARRLAGLKVETTRPSAIADPLLRMTLIDATGRDQFEIATWNRRETDRAHVDALADAIRTTMRWTD